MKELTARQKEILVFIAKHVNHHSYPPTIREIADHFDMSVKGAYDHVAALKKKGVIKHDENRSRAIEVLKKPGEERKDIVEIPILGEVAAGQPILTEENRDGTVSLHLSMLKKNKKYFAVKVRGDSMTGAGIMEGDIAVIEKASSVNNGEIAVAEVEDEGLLLKRFYRESARIRLVSENPAYKPKYCRNVRVHGRLARIVRYY